MTLIDLFPGVLKYLITDKQRSHISPPIPILRPIKGGSLTKKKTKRKY